jgi:hypothetical protein
MRHRRQVGHVAAGQQSHPRNGRLDHLALPFDAIPHDRTDRVGAADARDRSAVGVEDEPSVDSPHSIDEDDLRDTVIRTRDRYPGPILDIHVD